MKDLNPPKTAVMVLLIALGVIAGGAKVMGRPDEAALFDAVGLGGTVMLGYGVVQIAAGILMIPGSSRVLAAWGPAVCFLGSAVMLLFSGNIGFGLFSLVPAVLAGSFAMGPDIRKPG